MALESGDGFVVGVGGGRREGARREKGIEGGDKENLRGAAFEVVEDVSVTEKKT